MRKAREITETKRNILVKFPSADTMLMKRTRLPGAYWPKIKDPSIKAIKKIAKRL